MIGNISALFSSLGFAIYTVCVRSEPNHDWSPILPGYACRDDRALHDRHARRWQHGDATGEGHRLPAVHGALLIVVGTILFDIGSARCRPSR